MRFRPCIDIHNGKVKQIVGSSLNDNEGNSKADENFVADKGAAYYADMYMRNKLPGGHIILLNKKGTAEYGQDIRQAEEALDAYPGGMQIGGGIDADNAERMLDMGASHVIVTSAVFKDGMIDYDNLKRLSYIIGKERLVLDLSCRKKEDNYYIVTDRWQRFTDEIITTGLISDLGRYCDEFLVHAVDVEGCAAGIERDIARLLGECGNTCITYAGGIKSMEDIKELDMLGNGRLDFTIGSALDIFGGPISFDEVAAIFS